MIKKLEGDQLNITGNLFRKIWHEYQDYMMEDSSQISPHQMYFLNFLERKKTLTPSEIAEQHGITLGAVTGFVDRLYKLGLITRTRSEEDRRLVLIELTPEGEKRLRAFDTTRQYKHAKILSRIGADEIEQLNQSLEKFRAVLDELKEKE
jgi:DNA-binding MarR family transcriptional regulator